MSNQINPERCTPKRHHAHVRWLATHYALSMETAEREAQARYVKFPTEIERWS